MIKLSVKKPFTVLVAVVMIIALGAVSLSSMTVDLLPEISLPYMVVVTTYPGASSEKVEADITVPIEAALGTVSGVKNVSSSSNENYSMVSLEFEDDTDMDSALVKVFSALDPVEANLPEDAGTPGILEISADMIATAYVGFQYDGKDIYELTSFVDNEIVPSIEGVDGVARVTAIGLVEKTVHIELNEGKVDALNDRILAKANRAFADAMEELSDAEKKLNDAQKELDDNRADMADKWDEYEEGVKKLKDTRRELDDAQNELEANETKLSISKGQINSLINGGTALCSAYDLATATDLAAASLPPALAGANLTALQAAAAMMPEPQKSNMLSLTGALTSAEVNQLVTGVLGAGNGITGSSTLPEAGAKLGTVINSLLKGYDGMREAAGLSKKNYSYPGVASGNIDLAVSEWDGLWGAANATLGSGASMMESGKSQIASGRTQLEAGEDQLDAAKKQLEEAEDKFKEAQETIDDNWEQYRDSLEKFNKQKNNALKSANADQLLKLETLSQLIYAQNFEMPAGYIDDKNDNSWLLKIGENIDRVDFLNGMVLTNIADIGDIRISDVADITMIDNADDSYAKINGESGIVLAVYKSSTSSTKEVGDAVMSEAARLQEEYQGLHSMSFFNQGDYISLITKSILQSMIIGTALAILILALFIKDFKPTVVVAVSIPLSVMLAIVCLYFAKISLNIMSLAGLALGVGMLVDNSIVVTENVYRLKTLGISAAQAAVTGARQVAAPIISSTLTTIAVFVPMIFTKGLVKELLIPMAASVVFCLAASLFVALTVVPAAGSTLLKRSVEKQHSYFDRLMERYGRSLDWCLKHKLIPLVLTVSLLAASVYEIVRMGVVIIPDMHAEPLVVSIVTDEEKTRAESYEIADQVLMAASSVSGVEAASAMTSESMASMFISAAAGNTDEYHDYVCYLMIEGENQSSKEIKRIVKEVEEKCSGFDCEISISANEMDLSALTGAGLSVNIYGNDIEKIAAVSEDVIGIVKQVDGYVDISNGMEDGDNVVHLYIDKNKAMSLGLSVAQIYMDISAKIKSSVKATTLTIDGVDMAIEIEDATHPLTKENLLDYSFDVQSLDSDNDTVTRTYRLSDIATVEEEKTVAAVNRDRNSRYMTVTANVAEGKNATLLARELKPLLDEYEAPLGYRVELSGESEEVNNMVVQMSKLIALGFLFIYLVMVAQFQSLLSPFIVLFTVPLAFTGGMAALLLLGEQLSIMSLMGFTILMGTVVNNGIVFIDYANQLRIEGKERREALIETGKTRMRPILMTALTTILAMSSLLFGQDIGSQMGRGMAAVIMGGLSYATFMTLYIIPVIYDIFFKKAPLNVQVE